MPSAASCQGSLAFISAVIAAVGTRYAKEPPCIHPARSLHKWNSLSCKIGPCLAAFAVKLQCFKGSRAVSTHCCRGGTDLDDGEAVAKMVCSKVMMPDMKKMVPITANSECSTDCSRRIQLRHAVIETGTWSWGSLRGARKTHVSPAARSSGVPPMAGTTKKGMSTVDPCVELQPAGCNMVE